MEPSILWESAVRDTSRTSLGVAHVRAAGTRIRRFVSRSREQGATAVEYALMVGVISVGIVGATATLQSKISSTLGKFPAPAYSSMSSFVGSTPGYLDGTGPAAQLDYPRGLVFDPQGNLLIAEVHNSKIRKVSPAGVVTTLNDAGFSSFLDWSGATTNLLNPTALVFDSSGNLFVIDRGHNRILKQTPSGAVSIFAGSGGTGTANGSPSTATFNYPYGMTIDGAGNLIVAEYAGNDIRKIAPDGTVSTLAGTGTFGRNNGPGNTATFGLPTGVAVDSAGNVYVADHDNPLIRKITPAGVVSTFAGSGSVGSADGSATSASFSMPSTLTIDSAGNLYLVGDGHTIRKITPDGTVTTLAGGATAGYLDGDLSVALLNLPVGLAIDKSGRLFVGERSTGRIRIIS